MKQLGVIAILGICLVCFFHINQSNYKIHKEIKRDIVEHPELLPDTETAKITSMGFKNLTADVYWLQAIQYIGGNAIEAEYKKYLFVILDLITELNPYFESPYIIGQLLLPDHNYRYEDRPEEEQNKNINQGEQLGLKGVKNFCDSQKVEKVFAEDDLGKLWENEELRNPCKTYTMPYYLAYIYFFYKNDPATASKYYKLASTQDDAPEGAKTLTAIMQGKAGDREKSLFMFLSLAENVESEASVCQEMSQELQNIYLGLTTGQLQLDGRLIASVEATRDQIFPKFSEEQEEEILDDTKCTNFLHKGIRELNLLYIELANAQFEANHPKGLPARNAQALFEEGYIDFLPTDYQQYEEQGIVYEYDYEKGRYDYVMGRY